MNQESRVQKPLPHMLLNFQNMFLTGKSVFLGGVCWK
ncbi:hypothetical protein SLEP1_g29378 [Rubroshorea leprosula]|uniref:Uncharacterized protein n=1 Tax=Rubroshorea leprosula TaxID=152421 RepID=A0AAV5K7F4_9ROSI|nr:hypothetical protein SLEP1_g29378 [Rubroshorea leprosula]